MPQHRKNHLILKIIILGGLIAALVYLFHPGVGQFGLLVNGEPVTDPLFRLAAIPALLVVLFFIGILVFMAILGVGMFMFMLTLGFSMLGILLIAPYFWPVLLMLFLVIIIMSSGSPKDG
jgi:hypothetical protein